MATQPSTAPLFDKKTGSGRLTVTANAVVVRTPYPMAKTHSIARAAITGYARKLVGAVIGHGGRMALHLHAMGSPDFVIPAISRENGDEVLRLLGLL